MKPLLMLPTLVYFTFPLPFTSFNCLDQFRSHRHRQYFPSLLPLLLPIAIFPFIFFSLVWVWDPKHWTAVSVGVSFAVSCAISLNKRTGRRTFTSQRSHCCALESFFLPPSLLLTCPLSFAVWSWLPSRLCFICNYRPIPSKRLKKLLPSSALLLTAELSFSPSLASS